MKTANIALISTLYDTQGADFYKDIYFPVIKYAAMSIYFESNSTQKYYDIAGLQDCITNKIGVAIPIHVLRNSIKAISKRANQDVILELYQKGDYFLIKKNWDACINVSIEKQSDIVSANFQELNLYFKEYLKTEQLSSNKEFIDFFLCYAEDISNYINNGNSTTEVNEDFVNVVRFIDWLHDFKTDSYNIIDNLMWGAIVAGFLQRNNIESEIKVIEHADYYLDTSLVLSLLNLDSDANILYAKDLLRIIKESGATPYVHALTAREITRILASVETAQGPKPGTSIEHAWASQGLTLLSLLHIRNNLERILQKDLGISIQSMTPSMLDAIEKKYKNNFDVKTLAEERRSYGEDRLREIHDVYMKDYVKKLNATRSGAFIENQSAYFVSMNSDLVTFASKNEVLPSVIHPSKVVMNLWIHSAKSENIKKEVLAEAMSRCYALNQTDVRHKLKLFQKYYKDSSITKEDVDLMYTSLIKRSANTINECNKLLEIENSDQEDKEIASREIIHGIIAAVTRESEERNAAMQGMKTDIHNLKSKLESMDNILKTAQSTNLSLDLIVKQHQNQASLDKDTISSLTKEVERFKEISAIDEELIVMNNKKLSYDQEKNASIKLFKYWFIIALEVIGIIVLIICIVMAIKNKCSKPNGYLIGSAVTFFGLIARLKDMYIIAPGPSKEKVKKEQIECWVSKHPEYTQLLIQIQELENKKRSLQLI